MVVKGAVSIVENALSELDRKKIGEGLDAERRAVMVSNLLVVLVGDRDVQPVINIRHGLFVSNHRRARTPAAPGALPSRRGMRSRCLKL
jgi:hypothetical protein